VAYIKRAKLKAEEEERAKQEKNRKNNVKEVLVPWPHQLLLSQTLKTLSKKEM